MSERFEEMNCFQFGGLAHDLGRRKHLGPELRAQALGHAESCLLCGRLLAEVEQLDFALRSLATEQSVERAHGRVEAALVGEFLAVRKRSTRRSVLWQLAAVAAAAVVLVTGGWALHHFAPEPAGSAPTNGLIAGTRLQGDSVVAENESENRFVRLPYAADGRAVEDDAIVRAELPRSALVSLGFLVDDLNGTEMVPVELMVSEDGTPEAIRLGPQEVEE